jgi:hypothetical protein
MEVFLKTRLHAVSAVNQNFITCLLLDFRDVSNCHMSLPPCISALFAYVAGLSSDQLLVILRELHRPLRQRRLVLEPIQQLAICRNQAFQPSQR